MSKGDALYPEDVNPCEEIDETMPLIGLPQTATFQISATQASNGSSSYNIYTNGGSGISTGQTLTWSLPTISTSGNTYTYSYPSYFPPDERKYIPHKCRCDKDMAEPHEDHIYIKKMWFCSITCYEGYLVACIGENIDG